MNNNDASNNLNGTVLGNVNNTTTNTQVPMDNNIETLDIGISSEPVVNNQVSNANAGEGQSTYFANPPINDNNISSDMGQSQVVMNEPTPASQVIEPTPQVIEPMPAYTNPQAINQNPMSGFENPNVIGTTPPISLEPEKQPQKKKGSNKILFVIIILIVLAGVGFGTYYILNYTDLINKAEQVKITTNDLEISMGEELSTTISDYATIAGTDAKNCSLNTVNVDTTKEGIYEYTVTCGETIKTGKITVVDNTEVTIETKEVYKVKGEALEAQEFIINEMENATYEFVDAEKVNALLTGEPGTYTIKIKVIKDNKTIEVEGNLILLEHAIKGYLTCSSNEQNVENVNAKMTVAEKFAISDDGNNGYGKITYEIYKFKFTDETEYASYLASYKTENSVTLNNITGDASFDDDTLTISILNEKSYDTVISEYGEANMVSYQTISKYFKQTLGYQCIYEKVED